MAVRFHMSGKGASPGKIARGDRKVRIILFFRHLDLRLRPFHHLLFRPHLRRMFLAGGQGIVQRHAEGRGGGQDRSAEGARRLPFLRRIEHALKGFDPLPLHLFLFEEHIFLRLRHDDLLLRAHA